MKKVFFTLLSFTLLYSFNVHAQVMIGASEKPQDFSILELDGNGKMGLRMPQLLEADISMLVSSIDFGTYKLTDAKGLIIYNLKTNRLEFWNGTKWVEF